MGKALLVVMALFGLLTAVVGLFMYTFGKDNGFALWSGVCIASIVETAIYVGQGVRQMTCCPPQEPDSNPSSCGPAPVRVDYYA